MISICFTLANLTHSFLTSKRRVFILCCRNIKKLILPESGAYGCGFCNVGLAKADGPMPTHHGLAAPAVSLYATCSMA